jgi:VanZ family protein
MSKLPEPLRWLPAAVMMLAIFAFSSLTADRLPFFGRLDFLLKKGGHAIGYAMLAAAYFYAMPPRLSPAYRLILAFLMALLFALSDEFHQSFVEGRTSTLRDVLIDSGGACSALLLVGLYSSNSRTTSRS